MSSTTLITNCINYSLLFLNKNSALLDYVKNFNSKHNLDRTGFIYNSSTEMKLIRKEYLIVIFMKWAQKMSPL